MNNSPQTVHLPEKHMGGIYFKVSDDERRLIEQKMELAGFKNMSAYIRKMCIDGYTIRLDIPALNECAKCLRYAANNLNQIARRVNSDGSVYADEIRDMQTTMTKTNELFGNILEQLSKLR